MQKNLSILDYCKILTWRRKTQGMADTSHLPTVPGSFHGSSHDSNTHRTPVQPVSNPIVAPQAAPVPELGPDDSISQIGAANTTERDHNSDFSVQYYPEGVGEWIHDYEHIATLNKQYRRLTDIEKAQYKWLPKSASQTNFVRQLPDINDRRRTCRAIAQLVYQKPPVELGFNIYPSSGCIRWANQFFMALDKVCTFHPDAWDNDTNQPVGMYNIEKEQALSISLTQLKGQYRSYLEANLPVP